MVSGGLVLKRRSPRGISGLYEAGCLCVISIINMTAASNIQMTPCSRGHQKRSEMPLIWNQPAHACSRNWTIVDTVTISRKSEDLLPVTIRKCYCKIPGLGILMKETILQKLKKHQASIVVWLVGF